MTAELPPFERLQLRVLIGTFKMLEAQVSKLPDSLRASVFGRSTSMVVAWRTVAEQLHAETADAPEPVERATTMGDAGT